jgi:pimeloyl-ACP methyl ester carboxylesterase
MILKFRETLLTTGLVVGGILGTMAIANRVIESQAGRLDTVLAGEERRYSWKYGDVFYKVKGDYNAKPVLLIHGFGPGASSFEWRKNVDALAEQFHVYVIDLPGYGLSDHAVIDYTAETYIDLIADFITEVIGRATIVVVHGLSCAYVIYNAYRRPQLYERLVLVAPPATVLQEHVPGPFDSTWKFVLRTPVVGEFIYNLLTTRQAIRAYYDVQGYANPGLITDDLVEYIFTSAHQPYSQLSAASFLGHHLSMDVHEALERLQQPVLAIWGREDEQSSQAAYAFNKVNPGIDIRVLDNCSRQLQDEQAYYFNNVVREFARQEVYK